MLKKLRTRIKRHGINQVAFDLKYRSVGTVYSWLRKGKIPRLAEDRVKGYLKRKVK